MTIQLHWKRGALSCPPCWWPLPSHGRCDPEASLRGMPSTEQAGILGTGHEQAWVPSKDLVPHLSFCFVHFQNRLTPEEPEGWRGPVLCLGVGVHLLPQAEGQMLPGRARAASGGSFGPAHLRDTDTPSYTSYYFLEGVFCFPGTPSGPSPGSLRPSKLHLLSSEGSPAPPV